MKEIGNADRHEVGRLNNRKENPPAISFRRRERAMQVVPQSSNRLAGETASCFGSFGSGYRARV